MIPRHKVFHSFPAHLKSKPLNLIYKIRHGLVPGYLSDLLSDNSFPFSPYSSHCFFQELTKHIPTRPLHLLSTLPGKLFPQICTCFTLSVLLGLAPPQGSNHFYPPRNHRTFIPSLPFSSLSALLLSYHLLLPDTVSHDYFIHI